MAEIRLEYPELQETIENSIEIANNQPDENIVPLPECFKAAMLASLSEKTDDNTTINYEEAYALWDVQIRSEDQGAFGEHFIIIQDVILDIIKKIIENGIMGKLIDEQFTGSSFTPVDLIKFINTILKSLRSLDGCDICLAYKGADKPTAFLNPVEIDDLKNWFPGFNCPDGLHKCDMTDVEMHKSCGFFNFEDDICMITKEGMDESVKSLKKKGIIVPPTESETCRFKW